MIKLGELVGHLTVHQNGNVVWGKHETKDACILELRKLQTPHDADRYEYLTYFSGPPPMWWKPFHKSLADRFLWDESNRLSDRTKPLVIEC